jgi:AbrB family looped-hinge helix DNA binding protein
VTTTTVSTKGQIVRPATPRRRDRIRPGQRFEIERTGRGEYVLRRVAARANEGFVDLLLACPAKDWFRPADRSESTDDAELPDLG